MSQAHPPATTLIMQPLVDFGTLQARYGSLKVADRAGAVLVDADPAVNAAISLLESLTAHPQTKETLVHLRKDHMRIGKMRPSEARNMLMDASCDFIEGTRRKLLAWRKTIERLTTGEAIMSDGGREFIPGHAPLAIAILGNACVSNYLSIIQLICTELAKTAPEYRSAAAEIRRCATVLSDCETASGIDRLVH